MIKESGARFIPPYLSPHATRKSKKSGWRTELKEEGKGRDGGREGGRKGRKRPFSLSLSPSPPHFHLQAASLASLSVKESLPFLPHCLNFPCVLTEHFFSSGVFYVVRHRQGVLEKKLSSCNKTLFPFQPLCHSTKTGGFVNSCYLSLSF